MRIFVEVYHCGSMTRAAENLYMAQPAVSRAIADLEAYYGTKFFERISRRLVVTEAGKAYYSNVTQILGMMDRLDLHMKNIDNVGVIRLGSSITIGTKLLPDLVVRFSKQYPDIKIKAVIENSARIEALVLDNRLDLGIIEGSTHYDQISYEDFRLDRMAFICSKNHKFANREIKMAALEGSDFLLREEGSAGREQFEFLRSRGNFNVNTLWESASTKAIISGVEKGIGLSLLPELLVEDAIHGGEIASFTVKDLVMERHFKVMYHKNKYFTPALTYLKDRVIKDEPTEAARISYDRRDCL
jgi:DNA-binding transcriptional LysR family regulator